MDEVTLNNSRQQGILELLAIDNTLSVKELAAKLGVSLVTVRRDLEILQKYNLVAKFHGGVSLNKSDSPQSLFNLALEINSAEKKAMAKIGASLIKDRDVVGIDASSSSYYIADYVSHLSAFSVITYSLIQAQHFSTNPHANVFQLGGSINGQSACTTDSYATNACSQFHADITFFSNHAVDSKRGCFDSTVSLDVKRALIAITKRSVLLADSSKFEKTAMCLTVPFDDIDTIITDENIAGASVSKLLRHNVELYIVGIENGEVLEHHNPIE